MEARSTRSNLWKLATLFWDQDLMGGYISARMVAELTDG